jgi:hypothetical protein
MQDKINEDKKKSIRNRIMKRVNSEDDEGK